jgi:hypothetical protein
MNKIFYEIKLFLQDRFNFSHELDVNIEAIKTIEKYIEFITYLPAIIYTKDV